MAAINLTLVCETCGVEFSRDRHRNRRAFCGYACSNAREAFQIRFWAKVNKTENGCWLWTGSKLNGHGSFKLGTEAHLAHRISWLLSVGSIPPSIEIMHLCDVNYAPGDITYRACVRPSHLMTATHVENMAWARSSLRSASGERNGKSKLTDGRLVGLFEMIAAGASNKEAGLVFGINPTTVQHIRRGERREDILKRLIGAEKYEALRIKALEGRA